MKTAHYPGLCLVFSYPTKAGRFTLGFLCRQLRYGETTPVYWVIMPPGLYHIAL